MQWAVGQSQFEWLASNKDQQALFNSYMASRRQGRPMWFDTYPVGRLLGHAVPYEDTVFLVDVGGNQGHDLCRFRREYPHLPGTTNLAVFCCHLRVCSAPFAGHGARASRRTGSPNGVSSERPSICAPYTPLGVLVHEGATMGQMYAPTDPAAQAWQFEGDFGSDSFWGFMNNWNP